MDPYLGLDNIYVFLIFQFFYSFPFRKSFRKIGLWFLCIINYEDDYSEYTIYVIFFLIFKNVKFYFFIFNFIYYRFFRYVLVRKHIIIILISLN
jgi:hypothetical protein